MLENLKNGEDIDYTKSVSDQFEKLNDEVEEICDPKNWEPPEIRNSLGLFNYVNKGVALVEGNPTFEVQMLKSVFQLICEQLDDKTSRRIARAIWDR
jgi:hypothetical protein